MRLRNDLFEDLLRATANVIVRSPWQVIVLSSLLAVLSLVVSVRWLEFQTDQNALVSNDLEYNKRYLRFEREFGDLEYLYVVIDVRDVSRAMAIADAVAEEMRGMPEHVREVFHRVDVEPRSGLVFVPTPLLERASALLESNEEAVGALRQVEDLPGFCRFVAEHLDASAARDNPELAAIGLSAVRSFLDGIDRALAGESIEPAGIEGLCDPRDADADGRPDRLAELVAPLATEDMPARELERLLAGVCTRGYVASGGLFFVRLLPEKDFRTLEVIREPLQAIRAGLDRVRERFPGDRIGLTGRPVLQADEMETTNDDMTRAAILATLGVLALFILFFREVRRPTLAAVALLEGIAMTFGVVTITLGYLNLLTMVFAVMLVSMAMEFGIHLIARYQEELAATGSVEESVRNALVTAGKGNVTGAATTAAAFYTTLLVEFRGLAELGFIAGTGLLLCMIVMNTCLPAMLLVSDRSRRNVVTPAPVRLGVLGMLAVRPALTLPAAGLLILAGLPFVRSLSFNANLLDLQAVGLRSVEFEKLTLERPGIKTWFAAYIVPKLEEARRVTKALEEERYRGVIGEIESVFDYVPDDQERKIEIIRRLRGVLLGENGALPIHEAGGAAFAPPPLDVDEFESAMESLLDRFEGLLSGTLRLEGEGAAVLESLTGSIDDILEKTAADPPLAAARLTKLQSAWATAIGAGVRSVLPLLDPLPTSLDALDPLLRQRVVSTSGEPGELRYLVHAYPERDVWKADNMEQFIAAIREVDPHVTGVPVQVYESTRLMREGFMMAALYSLVAVFVLMFLDFRSLLFTALAMIPVLLGLCWVAELMPLLGLEFNLANFFSVPILIGEGINGGVHIIHRFREDRSAHVATRSTGTAVTLSYLNTMTGFGMLLFASHRGLASLGGMMVLGSGTSLVASTIVLPSILRLIERRRWHADKE